jgi:predicted Zn-dependent protease
MKSIKIIFLLLVISMVTNSCVRNPVTGKRDFVLMSESQEQSMGDSYHPQVMAQFGEYQDDKLQRFIDEKGQQMAKVSHRPHLKYTFKIVDSPVVNAFAVPGGYVYFTRGIMAHFNNEAEFAGVLGHEIGHITARHSVKQYSKQMAGQVLLIGGMIASERFRQYGELAMQGMGLLFLKFSRDNESQSDKLGVDYSTAIGYDSHNMANFFETIHRISSASGQSVPDFMSTHPDPQDRHNKVHQMSDDIQQKTGKTGLKTNRDQYLQLIEGLVYGEDPRQGYVENWNFYHPDLKFQFPVPNGWRYQNSPAMFQMAPEDGKAVIQLSAGSGSSLAEAKNTMIQNYKLTERSSKNINVNGFTAIEMVADKLPEASQQQGGEQQQTIRLLTYFIQYNGLIYNFTSMTALTDYPKYEQQFRNVLNDFRELKDPSKINRLPERIRIKTVNRAGTLQSVLSSLNQPSNRHEELAILNGMQLTDQVKAGDKLKTIGK